MKVAMKMLEPGCRSNHKEFNAGLLTGNILPHADADARRV